jgi:hypothetical protein
MLLSTVSSLEREKICDILYKDDLLTLEQMAYIALHEAKNHAQVVAGRQRHSQGRQTAEEVLRITSSISVRQAAGDLFAVRGFVGTLGASMIAAVDLW